MMIRLLITTLLLSAVQVQAESGPTRYILAPSAPLVELPSVNPGDVAAVNGGVGIPVNSETRLTEPGLYTVAILPGDSRDTRWIEIQVGESDEQVTRSASTSLLVDSAPPRMSLSAGTPSYDRNGTLLVTPATPFSVTSEDISGVADLDIRLDGEPITGRQLNGPWPNGKHNLSAVSRDAAGNQSETIVQPFRVIAQPPEIRLSIGNDGWNHQGQTFYSAPVDLKIDCADADLVANLMIYTDGQPQSLDCGQSIRTQATSASIGGTDVLGRTLSGQLQWQYEGLPPDFEITATRPFRENGRPIRLRRGTTLTIHAKDGQSGLKQARYRVNGPEWYPLPAEITFAQRGWYQVELSAEDQAGNQTSRYIEIRTGTPRSVRPRKRSFIND